MLTITENVENNGTEKIGLVTPTPGLAFGVLDRTCLCQIIMIIIMMIMIMIIIIIIIIIIITVHVSP